MMTFKNVFTFIFASLLLRCSIAQQHKIKNVLILLADDIGLEAGVYLNRYCQTPNIDGFAKKSLIFNNAFTSASSCSPSRAQILTGFPSHQSGMYGLHNSVHHFNVFDNIQSLPNVLGKESILTGLIGKKHVGPKNNFKFTYEKTEENHHSINQVGRNITQIKLYVREFLNIVKNTSNKDQPFFLMIGFHDPHRCGHITPEFGEFCERWGSGEFGMGTIPDWKPIYYDWRNLPYLNYLQTTDSVRKELAAQYMTISRLDQGIGLVLKELELAGHDKDTLVIYTSDNGPPYPLGRTNFYDHGIREPLIMYSPEEGVRRNSVSYAMTSLLDIYPTVLDAFNIRDTTNIERNTTAKWMGKSLLPLLKKEPEPNPDDAVFGSQNLHEVTMNYPMRMIRTKRFKLIHNLAYQSYFPIDQDLYTSDTFQEILNLTINKQPLPWYKTLKTYYSRPEWEMYDLKMDPNEEWNIFEKSQFENVRKVLQKRLLNWQIGTNDPWRCSPHGVLQDKGLYKENPLCMTLGHESFHKSFKKSNVEGMF